jgi:hypothetical protein
MLRVVRGAVPCSVSARLGGRRARFNSLDRRRSMAATGGRVSCRVAFSRVVGNSFGVETLRSVIHIAQGE